MASNIQYTYDSLSDRIVRLLQLWPGPPLSPLTCSLVQVSLDDANLKYKALSYVWGDEFPQSTLWIDIIDRKQFLTPLNLATALRQLRENQLSCCDLSCVCREDLIGSQQGCL